MKALCSRLTLSTALLLTMGFAFEGQTTPPNVYRVVNLVSNASGVAAVTDVNLVDPLGNLQLRAHPSGCPTMPAGFSTVYAATGVASATIVTIPGATGTATGSIRTGQVQNSAGAALYAGQWSQRRSFIFSTEELG